LFVSSLICEICVICGCILCSKAKAMKAIVDCHAHYIASSPNAKENWKRLVDDPALHRVVVCALNLKLKHSDAMPYMETFATTNEQLAGFTAKMKSPKIVPFCYVDPRRKSAPKDLERWVKKEGMRGLKLYPPEGWYPDEPRVLPTFHAAEALGIPVLVHMGRVANHPGLRSKFARPLHLEDVGLACPKLRLLLGHFAAPWYLEAIHIGMGFPEWRFDLTTSGSWFPEAFRLLDELHREWWDPGLGRVVLGTDGEGANNLRLARATIERIRGYGLSQDTVGRIAFDNGLAFLGEENTGLH
jgi:predicted TIM-barrel fold metal-dependent hydrolase